MFDGKVPHWHHFSCFWLRAAAQSPADISGYSDLRWADQEKVKKAIESGGATGGQYSTSTSKGLFCVSHFPHTPCGFVERLTFSIEVDLAYGAYYTDT